MASMSISETSFDNMKEGAMETNQKDFKNQIMSAAKHGELVVRNPVNKLPYIPKVRRDFFEVISVTDINAWLEKSGVDYRLNNDGEPLQEKGRRDKQISSIIQQAEAFEYSPLSIPYGGKKKIKDECLKDSALFTDSSFDHAWKEARRQKMIEVDNIVSYRKPS